MDCCINNRLGSFRRNTTAREVWPESIRCLQYAFLNFLQIVRGERELLNTGLNHMKNDGIGMAVMSDDIRLAKIKTTANINRQKHPEYAEFVTRQGRIQKGLHHHLNSNKPHFFGRMPVVLESCRSSRGGGGGVWCAAPAPFP